ncbi:MAG: DUF2075 domain-containing protein [Geodermatophilaceae bacterium]|nr:DUF2075 domain-containing protein [Geodermatophilaceae bacterium]
MGAATARASDGWPNTVVGESGFGQVGCAYTAQGFEYDWNGSSWARTSCGVTTDGRRSARPTKTRTSGAVSGRSAVRRELRNASARDVHDLRDVSHRETACA